MRYTKRSSACRSHRDDSRPFLRRQGNAVAKTNKSAGSGCHALARHKDAHQVKRVGGGNSDGLARGREVAQGAERFHRDRQSELFSEKAADKSSAADFSAVLEAPQSDQQLAPCGQQGLPREHVAEDHAVTAQQHPARGFQRPLAIYHFAGIQQRPTPCAVPWTRASPPPLSGTALGIDESAEIVKAVRGQQACRDKLPERGFHFGL